MHKLYLFVQRLHPIRRVCLLRLREKVYGLAEEGGVDGKRI